MYHVRATYTALVRPLRIEYRNVFGCKPQSAAASATCIMGTPNTSLWFVFIVELVLIKDLDIDVPHISESHVKKWPGSGERNRARPFPPFPLAFPGWERLNG